MPSLFVIKADLKNPQEWYDQKFENTVPWEYDETQAAYRSGSVYLSERRGCTAFEDLSESVFYGWPTENWKRLADAGDLLYGFYNEDAIEAEFIHIRDGACVREYRAYGGEIEIDEGTFPAFEDWADVCAYIDETLL